MLADIIKTADIVLLQYRDSIENNLENNIEEILP
jgi:hypothetical protein